MWIEPLGLRSARGNHPRGDAGEERHAEDDRPDLGQTQAERVVVGGDEEGADEDQGGHAAGQPERALPHGSRYSKRRRRGGWCDRARESGEQAEEERREEQTAEEVRPDRRAEER